MAGRQKAQLPDPLHSSQHGFFRVRLVLAGDFSYFLLTQSPFAAHLPDQNQPYEEQSPDEHL